MGRARVVTLVAVFLTAGLLLAAYRFG